MNDDLSSALHDLAGSAARAQGPGDALVTPDVVRRARRGRRRHDAVVGGVSAAAVTAVVLTGGTLLSDREPAPPAEPTPTASTPAPTPTPTPTTPPTVLPTGDPALPVGACASLVGEPSVVDGSGPSITAWPVPTEVPAGSALPVGAGMGFGQYGEFSLASQDGPVYLVTRDGVVVARGTGFASTTGVATLVEGGPGGWNTAGALDLAVCEPVAGDPATAGRALPGGSYELHAALELTTLPDGTDVDGRWTGDPADDLVGTAGGAPLLLLSEPVPFTVVGDVLEPAPRARTSPAPPAADRPPPEAEMCGTAVPERWDAGGLLTIEHPTDPVSVAVGDPVDLGARLAYRGPGRMEGLLEHRVDHLVVQDGVVVGRGGPGASDDWWSHATLDHGTLLEPGVFFQEWVIAGCTGTDPWDPTAPPLGAGEYQLVPTTTLQVDAVVLDDGTRIVLDQTHFLVGAPVPLTIR